MILEAKTSPPLVSSHYPKLILRGEVYLSPPPLHWVVAPAFKICSDYSRSRNLMLSPRARLQILTFFIFEKRRFFTPFFKPRRFSLEVSSVLKIAFLRFSRKSIKPQWILMLKKKKKCCLRTQNCRGKLTFKVAVAHLALRSPMFGELCIWFLFV